MGWSGPYPTLCPKRPTASLVSRKVLTPLLGQIFLTFTLQLLVLKAVQSQPWYITPKVGVDKSKIANSENTALFLVSTYQYILAAVVLNVGPPYREKMSRNVPFVGVVAAALGVSTWLVVYPGGWAMEVMQLTWVSGDFKALLLGLAAVGFGVSYWAEKNFFLRLAGLVGRVRRRVGGGDKKRKMWKVLEREMRM